MKKLSLKTALCCAVCALAATAFAQQDPDTSGTQPSQPSVGGMGGMGGMGRTGGAELRASKQVIGAQVKSQTGETLGKVEDLVVNPQSGKVDFAVISYQGKMTPIPWQLLQPSGTTQPGQPATFTANIDRSKLSQAPTLSGQWSELQSPTWSQQVYSFYGVQPSEGMGGAGTPTGGAGTTPGGPGGMGTTPGGTTPPAPGGSETK